MKRIMFVCHGNICRSPMAEFVFRKLVNDEGQSGDYFISSSATSTEELGNPVYPPVRALLSSRGIDTSGKYAVQLSRADYDCYDLFVGMDSANVRNMLRIFGTDPDKRIVKLLDYVGGGDVADPWYTRDFEATYRDICRGCKGLLEALITVKTHN